VSAASDWRGASSSIILSPRARNTDYRDEIALWSDTVVKRPDNAAPTAISGPRCCEQAATPRPSLHLETALRLRAGYPEVHKHLGAALARSGRFPEAIAHYRLALAENPDSPTPLDLGEALLRRGELAEALASSKRCAMRPDRAKVQNQSRCRFAQAGRANDAIAADEAAIRAEPDSRGLLQSWQCARAGGARARGDGAV